MALDEEKMRMMRGDAGPAAEPDGGEPDGDEAETDDGDDGAPSEKALECAGRVMAAIRQGDRRALATALMDLAEESY
jgi:hypothetical protein